jgi:hypothetical protein
MLNNLFFVDKFDKFNRGNILFSMKIIMYRFLPDGQTDSLLRFIQKYIVFIYKYIYIMFCHVNRYDNITLHNLKKSLKDIKTHKHNGTRRFYRSGNDIY